MIGDFLKKRKKEKQMDTAKKLALGATIGTVAGATAGILLAPQSGKETRDDIVQKASEAAETVKSTAQAAKENLKESLDNLNDKKEIIEDNIKEAAETIKESIEEMDIKNNLQDTVEEVKKDLKAKK